jgi:Polysaccharide pyruvyl transferase
VWGTGVMDHDVGIGAPDPKRILAVRGKLTHATLVYRGLTLRDIPLGDPGFLAPQLWVVPSAEKRRVFRLGVVPHYVDRMHPYIEFLRSKEGVCILDVFDPPTTFFPTMASCDAIVSTSLHGLIFAESLGLPNLWMELSDRVVGRGFKFRDWYSLTQTPQIEPFKPKGAESVDALLDRCEPRGVVIDREALRGALTDKVIEQCCGPIS